MSLAGVSRRRPHDTLVLTDMPPTPLARALHHEAATVAPHVCHFASLAARDGGGLVSLPPNLAPRT